MNSANYKVSYWHIPNGSDYHHAEARVKEFDCEDDAKRFAKQYENPPEMAFLITNNTENEHVVK